MLVSTTGSRLNRMRVQISSEIPQTEGLGSSAGEIRRKEWEEQQRRWRKEEAERKRKEAFKASRQQLLGIIRVDDRLLKARLSSEPPQRGSLQAQRSTPLLL